MWDIIVMLCQPGHWREGGGTAVQCDVTELATWRRSPVSVPVWSSSVIGGTEQQLPDLLIGCPAPPPHTESQAGVHGAKQIQLEVRQSSQQCSGATSVIVIVVVGEKEREKQQL